VRGADVEVGVIFEEEGPFGGVNFGCVGCRLDHVSEGSVGVFGTSISCLAFLLGWCGCKVLK